MNPIASLDPQISITLSPITISITPDCTIYMQVPGSPLLKTTLPALNVTLAPALRANIRMSMSLPFISASQIQAARRLAATLCQKFLGRCQLCLDHGRNILDFRIRRQPRQAIANHCRGHDDGSGHDDRAPTNRKHLAGDARPDRNDHSLAAIQ